MNAFAAVSKSLLQRLSRRLSAHDRRNSSHYQHFRGRIATREAALLSTTTAGDQAYNDYLQAAAKLKELQEVEELRKSKELYQAWQRASERESSNQKLAGVTVVKTLVKQTRKRHQQGGENKTSNADEDTSSVQYWESRMQQSLREAAELHGHTTALVQVGNQLLEQAMQQLQTKKEQNDQEVRIRLNRALDYYERACKLGSAEGCFNLGNVLYTGWPALSAEPGIGAEQENDRRFSILPPDYKAAMDAFRCAVDLGDTDAMYFLGVQFLTDEDSKSGQDDTKIARMKEGLELIERAGSCGHGGALYYLALLHLNGHEILDLPACSHNKFVERLNAAVDAGDCDALFLRGHSYYHGDSGYTLDYALALDDFLAAAELGHADAAVSAGAILHQPHTGVQRNQRRAFELYQHAGELGSRDGWRNVVACYLTGEGVPQSEQMAKYIVDTMLKNDG